MRSECVIVFSSSFPPARVLFLHNKLYTSAVRAGARAKVRAGRRPKYRVGTIVRAALPKDAFSRGFKRQFSKDLFAIHRIDQRLPIAMYTLRNIHTNVVLANEFYANHITLADANGDGIIDGGVAPHDTDDDTDTDADDVDYVGEDDDDDDDDDE